MVGTAATADSIFRCLYVTAGPAGKKTGRTGSVHLSARTAVPGADQAQPPSLLSAPPSVPPRNLLSGPPSCLLRTSDLDFALCDPDLAPYLLCVLPALSLISTSHPRPIMSPALLVPLLADDGCPHPPTHTTHKDSRQRYGAED